jgi:glycosyltransferase involved in cell wall biosynthesis
MEMSISRECFDPVVDLPHVAFVMLWYPFFTQPFIFREVEGLKSSGLPLTVYSLYGHRLHKCSDEMLAVAARTHCFGLRALRRFFSEFVRSLVCRPRIMFGLMRGTLLRRWLTLESAAEVCWGFFAGVYFARLFREAGIDIIYAPWPRGAGTAAWVASRLSGIPFALSARGDNLDPVEPDLLEKMKECLFIRANNLADKERMRRMLAFAKQEKITCIYNSLTLKPVRGAPVRLLPPVRILAVGRFSATKGFEYLLDACKILKDNGFAFKLTLIGGGGLTTGSYLGPRLEHMRKALGLEDHVRMPGPVSHNELPDIFSDHDIFAAPCVIAPGGQRDGIPNAVIEAMAFGLPVISTEVNAIPEIVRNGESGILVPQRDACALAEAVLRMSADPEEARRMAANGRRLVMELFDEGTNVRRLRDMFASAMRGARPDFDKRGALQ